MRARLDLSQEGRVIRMSKAILVMDMPSSCLDCPCSKFNPNIKTECRWECEANGMELSEIDLDIERPILCPLREIPKKENFPYSYNACIDEILGGGE